jgi:hypothetical protein
MKILQKICFVLLLTTFSSVYGGSCWDGDVDDCRVRAEQGDSSAQYNLGVLYERRTGVTQNDKESIKWVKKAAEQGVLLSQYYLGWMYSQGV